MKRIKLRRAEMVLYLANQRCRHAGVLIIGADSCEASVTGKTDRYRVRQAVREEQQTDAADAQASGRRPSARYVRRSVKDEHKQTILVLRVICDVLLKARTAQL